jgi:protein-arginine kinase activator protein McsA
MLCEECEKNQAEVMMTTVINGESTTRHLAANA